MSCNYADGLSPYHDKGLLGLDERFDSQSVVTAKVALLAKWMNEAKHVVIHTGAGISTSAGIPDFRGPRGVWTLQAKGEKPDTSKEFNEAIPTPTHMAITKLVEKGKVKYVVSQNIDGLHLRSNLSRIYLSELHGNMFTEQCNACNRQFVRNVAVPTVGQKTLNKPCPAVKSNGRPCRGKLHDTILDWEHSLPENDLGMADFHSCLADLSICLGTTMQIVPSGNLPLYTKKHGGKLVICNLQPTKHDRKADLLIHSYVDEVMTMLMKHLSLKIPKYSAKNDPTKSLSPAQVKSFEWTISDYAIKKMRKIYEEKCGSKEAKKRLEMIDDDLPLSIAKGLGKRSRTKEEDDSDLEVLDVIVKSKKSKESKRSKKNNTSETSTSSTPAPAYTPTITVKKVAPPPKKAKYEGEKITIKKNVTPTKTKYEIVQPKPKKAPVKCEIIYNSDSNVCNDLEMICESDDDEPNVYTCYNFRRYLHDDKDVKKEEIKTESDAGAESCKDESKEDVKTDAKEEKPSEAKQESSEEKELDKNKILEATEEVKIEGTEDGASTNEGANLVEAAVVEDAGSSEVNASSEENPATEENPLKEAETSEKTSEETNRTPEDDSKQSNPVAEDNVKSKESSEKSPRPVEPSNQNEASEKPEGIVEPETKAQETPENVTNSEIPSVNVVSESPEKKDSEGNSNASEPLTDGEKKTADESNVENLPSEENKNLETITKSDNLYSSIESEIPSLATSNMDSSIDQFVSQSAATQFDNALTIPDANINSNVNEDYVFYGNDYAAANTQPDLDVVDYVTNTYYNHF